MLPLLVKKLFATLVAAGTVDDTSRPLLRLPVTLLFVSLMAWAVSRMEMPLRLAFVIVLFVKWSPWELPPMKIDEPPPTTAAVLNIVLRAIRELFTLPGPTKAMSLPSSSEKLLDTILIPLSIPPGTIAVPALSLFTKLLAVIEALLSATVEKMPVPELGPILLLFWITFCLTSVGSAPLLFREIPTLLPSMVLPVIL